jgi:hypothetical protein
VPAGESNPRPRDYEALPQVLRCFQCGEPIEPKVLAGKQLGSPATRPQAAA